MKRRVIWVLLVALIGGAVYVGIALATNPSGVSNPLWSPVIGRFANGIDVTVKTDVDPGKAADLWQARLSVKGATDVHVLENIIAPGGSFGWHSHPGPSLVIVRSGTLSAYHGPGCIPEDFGPGLPNGATFVDGGHDTHLVRNNSATVTADVYVVSFVPAGFGRRIDEPNPDTSTCPN